jgi:hypothetical protein
LTDIGFWFFFWIWIITYWTVVFWILDGLISYQSTSDTKLSPGPLLNNSFNT